MTGKHTTWRWTLAVWALCLAGCGTIRLPAIDPTGSRIFLPPPNYTTIESPCDGPSVVPFLPEPAWQQPPPVPPCPEELPPCPSEVAPPTAVVPVMPAAVPVGQGLAQDRLEVTPTRMVAAVGSEVVLVAGICGPRGFLVTHQPIDWALSQDSVGNFVDAGEPCGSRGGGLFHSRSDRVVGDFAKTTTSSKARLITRGTAQRDDDVWVKKGQAWVSVTSPSSGVSRITVVAPGAENWEQRRQTVVIHWIDAQWTFPGPAIVPAGQPHTLVTTVTRSTDGQPARGWIVRYEVAGGVSAGWAPNNESVIEVRTDREGRAAAQLAPLSRSPGVTNIRIQVLAPALDGASADPVPLGQGFTTVTWSAAGLGMQVTGPDTVIVDGTAQFQILISNPGDLPARNVTATATIPPRLKFISSAPTADRFEPRAQWNLGDLAPHQTRRIDVTCQAVRGGDVQLCVRAAGDEGLQAENCAAVTIITPSLDVRFVDPPQEARVGERVSFNIEVTNTGTRPIRNVVARDQFEAGLEHPSGEASPIVRNLGELNGGQTSRFAVTFVARRPGRWCHVLEVTADDGHSASARACVTVQDVLLDAQFTLEGPPERQVGESGDYVIRVTNTGQAPLNNARISFFTEPSLLPEQASQGYQYQEGALIWQVGTLAVGQTETRTVRCSCVRADERAEVRAILETDQGIRRTVTASTVIRAVAAPPSLEPPGSPGAGAEPPPRRTSDRLQISIADTADPIPVGGKTSYIVLIQNDRDVADKNVTITMFLPEGLRYERFDPGGLPLVERLSADGRTIALPPIKELRAGETLRALRVEVTAVQAGVQRFRVEVTSLRSPEAVVQETETTVHAN